jgi:hypothetical protein
VYLTVTDQFGFRSRSQIVLNSIFRVVQHNSVKRLGDLHRFKTITIRINNIERFIVLYSVTLHLQYFSINLHVE